MTQFVSRFLKDESGATAIEYGLIASLIAVALIAVMKTMSGKVSTTFNNVAAFGQATYKITPALRRPLAPWLMLRLPPLSFLHGGFTAQSHIAYVGAQVLASALAPATTAAVGAAPAAAPPWRIPVRRPSCGCEAH